MLLLLMMINSAESCSPVVVVVVVVSIVWLETVASSAVVSLTGADGWPRSGVAECPVPFDWMMGKAAP